jgi:hypothetical protein
VANRIRRTKPACWIALPVGLLLGVSLLRNITHTPEEDSSDEPTRETKKLLDQEFRAVAGPQRQDEVRARMSGTPDLAARGLHRLSARELDELVPIRLRLARLSDPLCRAMWEGGQPSDPDEFMRALITLSDKEKRTWARVTTRAAILEIDQHPAPAAELIPREAIDESATRLPESRRAAFTSAFDPSSNPPASDGCLALKELMEHASSLPAALRERTYRALIQYPPLSDTNQ